VVRGKLSSRNDWERRLDAATLAELQTKVKELDLATLDLKENESKVLDAKSFEIDKDLPFQVVQQLQVVKFGDGDHRLEVVYKVNLNESVPRNSWPTALRRRFEKMNDEGIQSFLEDQLNKDLGAEPYSALGKIEELQSDEAKRVAAFDALPRDLAAHASVRIFGSARSSVMNDSINRHNDRLGSRNKDLSEIWALNERINRESDERGRREEKEELRAKLDIAKALQKNPKLADNKEPCEVIIGVIGVERFKKLSNASQMECESHLKKEVVERDEKRTEDETDARFQAQQSEQALQYHNQLLALAQGCIARAMQMAQQSAANSPQMTLVRSLYNGLVARGAGCTYFGAMMGDLSKESLQDDAFMAQVLGADPMLLASIDGSDYSDKARDVVKRQTTPAAKGVDQLLKQRECLTKMESLAGMSLQSLTAFSPTGGIPPEALQDPNVRQMMKFHDASKALLVAIDDELNVRGQSGAGGLRPMSNSSGEQLGRPQGLGSMSGGSRAPVRILDTNSAQAERGVSGSGNSVRRDSNTGRGSGSRPPPQFLGD
jgi:hypothetical protein